VRFERIAEALADTPTCEVINLHTGEIVVNAGKKWTKAMVQKLDFGALAFQNGLCGDAKRSKRAEEVLFYANDMITNLEDKLDKEIDKVVRGDELKPAYCNWSRFMWRRSVSFGRRQDGRTPWQQRGYFEGAAGRRDAVFAGRHAGRCHPEPLGVPSRMNFGQILETHMGWAAEKLG